MIPRHAVPLIVGGLSALILVGAGLWLPIEVRHSAPFGFSLTLDASRGLAVRGGIVVANYPNFNRVDLDLRAYDIQARYDLTIHIRPDAPGAADMRTVRVSIAGDQIRHDKSSFAAPFVTVRFPPIADSSGQRYYVWVDPGPRNRDEVVTIWSIKSFSEARGMNVLAAFLRGSPGEIRPVAVIAALLAVLFGLVLTVGWLMSAVTASIQRQSASPGSGRADERTGGGRQWYTLPWRARRG